MNFDFKNNDFSNVNDTLIITKPGIYEKCTNKGCEYIEDDKGVKMRFLYETREGAKVSFQVYPPAKKDNVEDQAKSNMYFQNTIVHFLSSYIPLQKIGEKLGTNATFKSIFNVIQEAIKASNKEVDIKIIGSVYDGKASSKIPYFPTWIFPSADVGAGKATLMFSNREASDNKKYFDFYSSRPSVDNALPEAPSGTPASADDF